MNPSSSTSVYSNPLLERYSSKEMSYIFSPDFKFSTWRKLWIALAEAEQKEGLDITDEQIAEMKNNINNIDYDSAAKNEKQLRHDVMAHVHTFSECCPKAAPIIHLGATSAYVGDNTDLIQTKEALILTRKKIVSIINHLAKFAERTKNLPVLGFTHFQPAQPTTLGKRTCLWIQELMLDLEECNFVIDTLPFRGVKGTTGTQASFVSLFNGDDQKIENIDNYVTKYFGFEKNLTITGQTYTRKLDARAANLLSSIAQSASKFATDIRLLQHKKEVEEPFEKKQIGSSAMAYKRNPMRTERMCSLARFVMAMPQTLAYTASTQWFERTLDDSANKRLSIPQAFMAVDAILDIWANVADGLVIYDKIIEKNLQAELPFMMTENILMEGVKNGGNRQDLHEKIRVLSMMAGENVKIHGKENNLLDLIAADETFKLTSADLKKLADPSLYTGRSEALTNKFLQNEVYPVLTKYEKAEHSSLRV